MASINREDEAQLRAAIVREAYEWIGTPYYHQGALKQRAADCAMFIVRVYAAVGVIPVEFDPRPYTADWHDHQDEARYLAGLDRYAKRTQTPGLGDILMCRYGRHASHGAIIVSDELIIHAHKSEGMVCLAERSFVAERADSYWSVFAS